jgi:hypothetical protein
LRSVLMNKEFKRFRISLNGIFDKADGQFQFYVVIFRFGVNNLSGWDGVKEIVNLRKYTRVDLFQI